MDKTASMAERLYHYGFRLRIAKTGLAAGLAWTAAQLVLGSPKPYLAPLAAIFSLQVTIAQSVSTGLQRVAGVTLGIILAALVSHLIGINAWTIGLLVWVALTLTTHLPLGPQGMNQVAVSALLILALGKGNGYIAARMWDTVIGAAVALVVNAIFIPPDYTGQAAQAVRTLAQRVGEELERLGIRLAADTMTLSWTEDRLTQVRKLDESWAVAQAGVRRARESLQWNFMFRYRRRRIRILENALEVLQRTLIQVRGIARTLSELAARPDEEAMDPEFGQPCAKLMQLMGQALKAYGQTVENPGLAQLDRFKALLADGHQLQPEILGSVTKPRSSIAVWQYARIAALVVDMEKMEQDLAHSANALMPDAS